MPVNKRLSTTKAKWSRRLYRIVLLLLLTGQVHTAIGQSGLPDSSYIRSFPLNNIIEVYTGTYSTHFRFSGTHDNEEARGFKMQANSSAHIGAELDYKWLSLTYSTAIPGTLLYKGSKLQYTSFVFNFGSRRLRFHPFYEKFNGLLIPGSHRRNFEPFKNISLTDVGVDVYWIANTSQFSFRAARSFSERQVKSAGSVIIIARPMWQKFNWQNPAPDIIGNDTATYKLLASNPAWASLTVIAGYGYNFSINNGKWMVAPAALAGGGLLKETNRSESKLETITSLQTWVSGGYNGDRYYCYLTAKWDNQQSRLVVRKVNRSNARIMLTAGLRFRNLKKKIAGIL